MKVVVIADAVLKEELQAQGIRDGIELAWQEEPQLSGGTDCYIDLLFHPSAERINKLKSLGPATIIVTAVNSTIHQLPAGCIRINGWRTLLKRSVIEAAANEEDKAAAEKIFSAFNKTIEWIPDIPGFITARVISMIINEAWFALEEKVSTPEEIDTAMKLGTNYPYGPFEWGEKIGLKNVYELLTMLAETNSRYKPATLLQKRALSV
ncbi:MAG TPA: 3-hydroxyacyl-CoA dehydrogenase family protein [Chitinophagaceae bacterium]|jgi:3-hydroxybutyryl-CoA dehydrogenase|nr:3-hydroxyacyl-CoA dehydrogenase family protein [Chitinophagaceae bacterium]